MNYHTTSSGIERAYLDSSYFDFLTDAEAIPIPVAPTDNIVQLNTLLSQLDGMLFTGGMDLNPASWQEKLHPKTCLVHLRRQRFEFMLYELTHKRKLPVLGICLGIQMINVAHGGSMHQHLPDLKNPFDHGSEDNHTTHSLNLNKKSQLYDWFKVDQINVNSTHHQGINRLGEGLLAAAAAPDGIIEAVELPNYPFLLAIQWHPELDPQNPINRTIIQQFLTAAKS